MRWVILPTLLLLLIPIMVWATEDPFLIYESDSLVIEVPQQFTFGEDHKLEEFAIRAGKAYAKNNDREDAREYIMLPVIIEVLGDPVLLSGDMVLKAGKRKYPAVWREWDDTYIQAGYGDESANVFVVFPKDYRLKHVTSITFSYHGQDYVLEPPQGEEE